MTLIEIGAKAVENAVDSDLIVVDEVGPMELRQSQVRLGCGEGVGVIKAHARGAASVVQSPSGQEDPGDVPGDNCNP